MVTARTPGKPQSGLKIPSGQIAGGHFTIAAGETKDLDIDFNACASIVATGSGKFMIKPVLHAGEVGLSSAINGTVIDNSTGKPLVGGTSVVALEQKDSGGVDRVVMSTLTDANGNFALCPVPTGSYDLVVASVNGGGTFYAPAVTTGVQASTAVGDIPVDRGSADGWFVRPGVRDRYPICVSNGGHQRLERSGYDSVGAAVRCYRECHRL
jgi:hypothetical protein